MIWTSARGLKPTAAFPPTPPFPKGRRIFGCISGSRTVVKSIILSLLALIFTFFSASAQSEVASPETWGLYLEQSTIPVFLDLHPQQIGSLARLLSSSNVFHPKQLDNFSDADRSQLIRQTILSYAKKVLLSEDQTKPAELASIATEELFQRQKDLQDIRDLSGLAENFPQLRTLLQRSPSKENEIKYRQLVISDELRTRYLAFLEQGSHENRLPGPGQFTIVKPWQLPQFPEDWKPSEEAAKAKFFLVKGFMGNHIRDYMEGNLRSIKALGLQADFIHTPTESQRDEGLKQIRQAVEAAPGPIVLIGHSRGGNHILDDYRVWPFSLKAKVSKIVLSQTPLNGAPMADWVQKYGFLRFIARTLSLLPTWGDVLNTMPDLSVKGRAAINASLPPLTQADLSKIHVIMGSIKPGFFGKFHQDFMLTRYIVATLTKRKSPNDGIVPVKSAILPGTHLIYLQDADHEDTILERPGLIKRLLGSRPHPGYPVLNYTRFLINILFSK